MIPEGVAMVITIMREVFMEHSWKRRLGVVAAAAVLASGLWAASVCSALASGDGGQWSSTVDPVGAGPPGGSDFCENLENAKRMADIQQLLASAPADIKPDLHKIFDPVLVAGGMLSFDQADHPADMAQVLEVSQHYLAYLRSHCSEFQH
jgi:hypothetical protein